MRISDWSSDVCSSDLACGGLRDLAVPRPLRRGGGAYHAAEGRALRAAGASVRLCTVGGAIGRAADGVSDRPAHPVPGDPVHDNRRGRPGNRRSEEHTSELQSLMRISYAVFCLKKKKHSTQCTYIRTTITTYHLSESHFVSYTTLTVIT